jgi:diguanylate cyclase (GGDEF)-like protein/PAS domain S-box-containing protein
MCCPPWATGTVIEVKSSPSKTDTEDESRWSFALESAGLGVWDADLVSGRCYYSRIWKEMLGYAKEEIAGDGDAWLRLVHPDDRERAIESGKAHELGLSPVIETEFRMRHKNGHWIWVLDRGKVIERDEAGKPTRMIGVQTEITKQKQAEGHLALLNERIRLAVEAGGVGLWHWDMQAGVLHWDQRMHALYGSDPSTFGGTSEDWIERLHPGDAATAQAQIAATLDDGVPFNTTYRIVRTDGEVRHIRALARIVQNERLPPVLVGTNWDVTDHVLAAHALADEKERLRIMLQSIGEAVICTDREDRVTFMNEAAEDLLERRSSDVLGQPLDSIYRPVHEETGAVIASSTRVAMREGRTIDRDRQGILVRTDNSRRSIRGLASPLVASTGEIVGSVLAIQDTTAAQALQRDLAYAATHDMLTGLKSRVAFETALTEALEDARAKGNRHALLYIDLDRFKVINDTAGHAAGDSILKNVGAALRSAVRACDIVARLGGDEFAVLSRDCGLADAERIAGGILALIAGERFHWSGKVFEIGASIGIAVIDHLSKSGGAVLACADVACYSAKSAGRNRLSVFRSDAGEARRHLSELQVASGIRDAIAGNRFRLYAQEIRDLASPLKHGMHVEILTRMVAPDGTILRPAAFIPAAERFDLMGSIDRWIIRAAFRDFASGVMAVPNLAVALNLSANSLSDPDLWSFVQAELEASALDPARLIFEITETSVINNYAASERFIAQARELGCGISLDDFGTGVSSFAYLKRFRVDTIKIDGAFVGNMRDSRYDRTIVRVIGEIAKEIGVDVIAEGIEDAGVVEILQSLGIRYGQGYLFHRPRPLAEVLSDYHARVPRSPALRVAR